ncbi:MAG: hypothetical protein ABIS46_04365 [Sphingomicrobium sp.]
MRADSATSTIWTGDVISTLPNGAITVDLAPFLTQDDFGIAQTFKNAQMGEYAFNLHRTQGKPNQ